MTRAPIFLAVLLLAPAAVPPRAPALSFSRPSLDMHFERPPSGARPLGWWDWVNGHVTREGIAADLEAAKAAGMGGVQLCDLEMYAPPGPVRYGSDEWFKLVRVAIAKCAELGLEFHVANAPGWSGSGGPWITPERAMRRVVFASTNVAGGAIDLRVPRPATKPIRGVDPALAGSFLRDIALFAVPAGAPRLAEPLDRKTGLASRPVARSTDSRAGVPRDRVLDLSAQMDGEGRLRARLPEGEWTLLRIGHAPTGALNHPAVPEGHGLEVDKLDAASVEFQFEQSVGPVIRAAGPLLGRTFKGLLFDSFEAGFQNWTDRFPAEFRRRKGYDLIPWLPLLAGFVLESEERSEAVLWDFRDVIEALFAENYFGTMQRLAARHGIRIYAESQGGPLNPMACNRHVDVPMNEFWLPEAGPRASRIKQSASSAAFLGRTTVAAEAFTAKPEHARFLATPASLKEVGDHAFTLGINRYCLHAFTHQPYTDAAPGFGRGRYGTHFGRLVTWWPLADGWIEYVSRCSAMLQWARAAADICLLVDEDLGYGLPSRTATAFPGFDFLAAYPPDLQAMRVEEGRIVHPSAGTFRILVTPQAATAKTWVAGLATLRKLSELVRQGAWLAGPPPSAPAGLRDLEQRADFDRGVAEVWGEAPVAAGGFRSVGKGRVYAANADPSAVLRGEGVPPAVAWTPADATLRFVHRETAKVSIYFVQRSGGGPERVILTFREAGRVPEIWDPLTGARAEAPVFRADGGTTSVPLDLEPDGSVFVVFRRPLPSRWLTEADPVRMDFKAGPLLAAAGTTVRLRYSDGVETNVPVGDAPAPVPVAGPWTVEFGEGPAFPVRVKAPALFDWAQSADDRVRHFAGTAVYRAELALSPPAAGEVVVLDLGRVADVARVFVNGREAGVLWHPPFRADITALVRGGTNRLEIRVANRWVNRLIGDAAKPALFHYQSPGKSIFTDGRLEAFPEWFHNDVERRERMRGRPFAAWRHWGADDPLLPSGLLGPVVITRYRRLPDLASPAP